MSAKETEIHILLDASTSMTPIRTAALSGVNAFLEEQKQVEGRVWVSLLTFHSRICRVWDRVPLEETAPLETSHYPLAGGTALYDAIGLQTVKVWTQRKLKDTSDSDSLVIFLIVTDGWDRGSRQFGLKDVSRLVRDHQAQGWTYLLLGAGAHLQPMAEGMGISPEHWLPIEHSAAGTHQGLLKSSRIVTTLRTRQRRPPE